jgi:AcrR family transcriptional regulator
MSRRPYRLGQRQESAQQTRARIIAAASRLLAARKGFSAFTVDAVASKAGVARMTVFNHFRSKRGLLEALFDDLSARSLLNRLRAAFCRAEPREALDELIAAFGGFWSSERVVLRRIRGLMAIDPDFERGVHARDERRREALRVVVGRLTERYNQPSASRQDEVIDLLHALTSFETFDNLAGPTRSPEEVVSLMCRLAHAVLERNEG